MLRTKTLHSILEKLGRILLVEKKIKTMLYGKKNTLKISYKVC